MLQRVSAETVIPLRAAILRPGQPLDDSRYWGDDDPHSLHLAWLVDGQVVGTATVIHQPPPHRDDPGYWRLRGVTLLPAQRGQGTGARLVRAALGYAALQRASHLWFVANPPAIPFYEHLGFTIQPGLNEARPTGVYPLMEKRISDEDRAAAHEWLTIPFESDLSQG